MAVRIVSSIALNCISQSADTILGGEVGCLIFTFMPASNRWGVGRRLVPFASSETRKSDQFLWYACSSTLMDYCVPTLSSSEVPWYCRIRWHLSRNIACVLFLKGYIVSLNSISSKCLTSKEDQSIFIWLEDSTVARSGAHHLLCSRMPLRRVAVGPIAWTSCEKGRRWKLKW